VMLGDWQSECSRLERASASWFNINHQFTTLRPLSRAVADDRSLKAPVPPGTAPASARSSTRASSSSSTLSCFAVLLLGGDSCVTFQRSRPDSPVTLGSDIPYQSLRSRYQSSRAYFTEAHLILFVDRSSPATATYPSTYPSTYPTTSLCPAIPGNRKCTCGQHPQPVWRLESRRNLLPNNQQPRPTRSTARFQVTPVKSISIWAYHFTIIALA
jgi:hypothetical protein